MVSVSVKSMIITYFDDLIEILDKIIDDKIFLVSTYVNS